MSRSLFLNVKQDNSGRLWGEARICFPDGGCLVIQSRVYREGGGAVAGAQGDEPPRNKALDEALDKLCHLVEDSKIKKLLPLTVRAALKLVCTARNLAKIKRAAEEDGDEETEEAAGRQLRKFARHQSPLAQRAYGALRLWH